MGVESVTRRYSYNTAWMRTSMNRGTSISRSMLRNISVACARSNSNTNASTLSRITMIRPTMALSRFSSSSSSSASEDDLDLQNGPLHKAYHKLVAEKDVHADPHQLAALSALERLRNDLLKTDPSDTIPPAEADYSAQTNGGSRSSSLFGNWFGSAAQQVNEAVSSMSISTARHQPRGIYLHGGVGCGKTFLMNLFYDSLTDQTCPQWNKVKQKVHFHKFMLGIHQEMHVARTTGNAVGSDAILPAVIRQTIQKGRLICFDEFQVTDVADALILQRLFTGLWQHGCVVVATSNRPPDELYLNGLQRDRFLPFIDVIKKECEVCSMVESETDYRLVQKMQSGNAQQVYFVGRDKYHDFDALFYKLVAGSAVSPTSLQTQGRRVGIPQASMKKEIARFSFADLCQKALGAADYLVIGQQFHTVFVEKVPVLTLDELNWVRRFITFVDSMYECNVKLIIQAKTECPDIFKPPAAVAGQAAQHLDEVFSFDRTVSRLQEMASQKYLQKRWARSRTAESKAALLSQHKAVVQGIEPS
jgi:protein AFG1